MLRKETLLALPSDCTLNRSTSHHLSWHPLGLNHNHLSPGLLKYTPSGEAGPTPKVQCGPSPARHPPCCDLCVCAAVCPLVPAPVVTPSPHRHPGDRELRAITPPPTLLPRRALSHQLPTTPTSHLQRIYYKNKKNGKEGEKSASALDLLQSLGSRAARKTLLQPQSDQVSSAQSPPPMASFS